MAVITKSCGNCGTLFTPTKLIEDLIDEMNGDKEFYKQEEEWDFKI